MECWRRSYWAPPITRLKEIATPNPVLAHVNLDRLRPGWWRGARRNCLPSFWTLRYSHDEGSTEQALVYLAVSLAAQAASHGGNWVRDPADAGARCADEKRPVQSRPCSAAGGGDAQ
ncbi:protein of unknown function [Ralstonia solanacearum CMR15]|nr:protein of unknown function [Ralstonia solanacearum CMR15]